MPTVGTRSDFIIIFVYLSAHKLDDGMSLPWGVRSHIPPDQLVSA
jgi:hypothetical protein